jgi:hypothetical protein
MNFRLYRALALSTACLVIAAATTPARATSGTLTLYAGDVAPDIAPYSYKPGGAFTVIINSGTVTNATVDDGYNSSANSSALVTGQLPSGGSDVTGFETFCAETLVTFNADATYNYSVGLGLQQAGIDGSSTADTGLTEGVAWLYQQYATGKLASDLSSSIYNTQSFSYTSTTSAAALQYAIWELEKEAPVFSTDPSTQPSMTLGSAGLGTDLIDLAEKAVDPSTVTVTLGNTSTTALTDAQTLVTMSDATTWDVYVLELTTSNGTPAQDQLIYGPSVHVPDGGRTIGLLGIALLTLAFFRRRAALQV